MINEEIKNFIKEEISKHLSQKKAKHSIFGKKERFKTGSQVVLQNTLFNVMSGTIFVDDYSFFGHNCMVITGTHDFRTYNRERQLAVPKNNNDIYIGKGVWIGSGSIIIGPTRIGDNSVIAAGSIVLPGSYDSNCIFAGNPAKLKKNIE